MTGFPKLRGLGRLLYASVCLLLALLAVLRAPTNALWQIAVLVTELGWVFAAAAVLVFLPGWRRTRAGRLAGVSAVIACVLVLSPMVRALIAARVARIELAHHFPGDVAHPPFRPLGAIKGAAVTPLNPATYEYARHGAEPVLLDFFRADSTHTSASRPLVVIIHGGSWRSGDRKQLPELNSYLARLGYATAAIQYRLAPVHRFPAALEDVSAAIAWLKSHAYELGIDSGRIALLGRSAGGHLALLAGYTLRDPAIRGVISFYGPTDLRWGWEHPSNPRVVDSRDVLRKFIGGTLEQRGAVFDRASPLNYTATAVPTLLLHGDRDELVSAVHARRLAHALDMRGAAHAYVRLPWATHGCDYVFRGPCGQISTWAVEQFLDSVMRRS